MSCSHRFDVGVYVLGALDPPERETFEAHLDGCPACGAELTSVAGLPGLLARAATPAPGSPDAAPDTGPEPPDLLPGTVRRVRRRRRVALLTAAAAVVLALVTGAGVATWTASPAGAPSADPDTVAAGPAREIALPAVAGSESSGLAGLAARPWGTQVSLTCLYEGEPHAPAPADAPRTTYVLVVHAVDGRLEQIASWSPPPGQDVRVAAATDLPPDRVSGLEVRTTAGAVVMRS
ncbi:anti-sigma factor [Actinomycetospora sp. TBRC 11914]|uniref:anti-sigma factor family protein n=1 Tax=Actinomycetospora sp. TBRC 11914 TaxID=2729387 RepID=UPI00145ECD3F|nr:zf-HC2 domain-containing protein [Actinomycetospora sp. TBRC 11914]NMO90985.1 zf-HC2 domain-containing protein [Actinomycetospora sp. TBRC 11914]